MKAAKKTSRAAIARRTPERSAAPAAEILPQRSAQVRLRQDKFLEVYAGSCTIAGACRIMGEGKKKNEFRITKECVRLWRRDDAEFEKRFQETKANLEGVLEDSTVDDALGEWSEKNQRYVAGNPLLKMFLLKKLNPAYREQFKLEHAGGVTVKSLLLEAPQK